MQRVYKCCNKDQNRHKDFSSPDRNKQKKTNNKFKRVFYFIGLRESLSLFLIYKLSIIYTLLRQVEEAVT